MSSGASAESLTRNSPIGLGNSMHNRRCSDSNDNGPLPGSARVIYRAQCQPAAVKEKLSKLPHFAGVRLQGSCNVHTYERPITGSMRWR